MDAFIREMVVGDAKAVADLESKLIAKTSKEAVLKSLENDHLKYFVLQASNEIVGFLQGSYLPPESEIFEVAIREDFQRKGYAKKLMNYYLDYAEQKGCDTIFLEVNIINKKAISLYLSLGFEEFGRRKNYYGENQDAILMKRKI